LSYVSIGMSQDQLKKLHCLRKETKLLWKLEMVLKAKVRCALGAKEYMLSLKGFLEANEIVFSKSECVLSCREHTEDIDVILAVNMQKKDDGSAKFYTGNKEDFKGYYEKLKNWLTEAKTHAGLEPVKFRLPVFSVN